jgi:hypothetical protein
MIRIGENAVLPTITMICSNCRRNFGSVLLEEDKQYQMLKLAIGVSHARVICANCLEHVSMGMISREEMGLPQ